MGEFIDVAFGFPTALFTFSLAVVAGYWLLVALGGADLDTDLDPPAVLGLGGVPATVVASLLIAWAWFVSLAVTALAGAAFAPPAALLGGWLGTRLLMRPLRRAFGGHRGPSRLDFVGRTCVVRTGSVTEGFGQAEVTAADGSTALVQVRRTGTDEFTAGSTALIFDYDPVDESFLVMPYTADLDPDRRTTDR